MTVLATCLIPFLRTLFPRETPAWTVRPTVIGGAVLAGFVALTPPHVFSRTLPLQQLYWVGMCFVGPAVAIRAVARGRPGAGLFLMGLLAALVAGVHDTVLSIVRDLPTMLFLGGSIYLLPYMLFVCLLSQAIMLAMRYSGAYSQLERATADLRDAHAELDSSLDALLIGPIEGGYATDAICARVGRRLYARTPPERYATAIIASLDPAENVLTYTNAGHNPGLLVRASRITEQLNGTGKPLGLLPGVEYERATVALGPGDLVVLYTDGITEAANGEGEEFGIPRLESVVLDHASKPLAELALAIDTAVADFAGEHRFADDRTLMILRRDR